MLMPRSIAVLGAATLLCVAILLTSAPAALSGSGPKEVSAADFGRMKWDRSTKIDNPWFPLRPGTQLVFTGSTRDGTSRISHRIVFTVTDLTKVVGGVRSVMIWERDWSDEVLAEAELAFFAQDNLGNVWHLGQYPEEYEDGKLAATPAWLHGLEDAKAGIVMKKAPRLGTRDYSQGFAPAPDVHWVDRAQVFKVNQRTCVPFRCFDGVLVTREFEPDKPDAFQLKYYARGVGNVRVGWAGSKDKDRETLVLADVVQLDQKGLAAARAAALKLEQNAYRNSKDVYAHTSPATRLPR